MIDITTLFIKRLIKDGTIKLVEPSDEITESYIRKSDKTLISAKTLYKIENYDDATALVYYTVYYSVLALLAKCGIKSENHTGTLILLKEVFGLDNGELLKAKKERVDKQYYTSFKTTKQEVLDGIKLAEDTNALVREKVDTLKGVEKRQYRDKFTDLYF